MKKISIVKKLGIMISGSILLAACAHTNMPNDENAAHSSNVALAEAASSVSESLTQLGATEQAARPPINVTEAPNPASYGMEMPTSIDWDGPIGPLVQQIANATNYKLKVLGKSPAIPIIVSISAKNTPIGDVLRNAGYQSAKKAAIVVFPSTHTIELRYANS